MKHIRRTFVRQQTREDCGIACLAMILKYTGRNKESDALLCIHHRCENGLSLLNLRDLAQAQGLSGKCVQMNMEYLTNLTGPCIFHMLNDNGQVHFQVYYGLRKKTLHGYRHLISDPATYIHYMNDIQLDRLWESKSALYFEGLMPQLPVGKGFLFPYLSLIDCFPRGMFISIPFFYLCTAMSGIMLSWVLQRGENHFLAEQKQAIVVAVSSLLLIVGLFKGAFGYIRQRLLIKINLLVYNHLMLMLLDRLSSQSIRQEIDRSREFIRRGMGEIQKIQQSVVIFLTHLLSEGVLIIFLLVIVFTKLPLAGLADTAYLLLILILTWTRIPKLLYDNAHVQELSGAADLHNYSTNIVITHTCSEKMESIQAGNQQRYLKAAEELAIRIAKTNLFDDWLGTGSIMLIFIYGIQKIRWQDMDYNSFLISVAFSFFITSLAPKLCNALYVIADGVEASRHYQVRIRK